MNSDMTVLVAGCGSIGRRHIRNLSALGVVDFILCDPSEEALKKAGENLREPRLVKSLDEAIGLAPRAAVICTPSSMHLDMSMRLAGAGVHLLIEKPLSNTLDGVEELSSVIRKNGVVGMMAMCYRFHPVLNRLKKMLEEGAIGKVYHVNYYGGQYLPDWHPYADYRKEYAARRDLGGGVVLTTIHGLDDIRWLFGEVELLHAFTDKVSDLEMDVEDLVVGVFRLTNGIYVQWQTDYLQRAKQHKMVITGSAGTVSCDISGGVIEIYRRDDGVWTAEEVAFDVNSMYVDEVRHFLDCIKNGASPRADIDDGIRTLRLAMQVKKTGGYEH